MAQTTFGSMKPQPTTQTKFGGFTKGQAGATGESALSGVTEFSGSVGIAEGGTKEQASKPAVTKEFGIRADAEEIAKLQAAQDDFNARGMEYKTSVDQGISEAKQMLGKEKGSLEQRKGVAQKGMDKWRGALDSEWDKLQSSAKATTMPGLFDYIWTNSKKMPVRVDRKRVV